MAAMAMVSEHTCVSFHRKNGSESDYLFFRIGHGYVCCESEAPPLFLWMQKSSPACGGGADAVTPEHLHQALRNFQMVVGFDEGMEVEVSAEDSG